MFFFFFYSDYSNDIIKSCFKKYIETNIENKCYCDIAELFSDLSKQEIKKSLKKESKGIEQLYKRKYPDKKEDLSIISDLFNDKWQWEQRFDYSEAFAILFWCFKYFKGRKLFDANKKEIMKELMSFVNNDLELTNYDNYDTIIFDSKKVFVKPVDNVSSYLQALKDCSTESCLYFRGHSKTSYRLIPSIMRSEKLKQNEHLIYQELLVNCPSDFKGFHRHIDYLVKMQHYGLPTRLLDITRNPLVALYFSCCDNSNSIGEVIVISAEKRNIKYGNSDTVAMISSLPLFSYEDQCDIMDSLYVSKQTNSVNRFIYEIQTEKPGFTNKIDYHDLENCFIVLPAKDNNRMIKQDGAFIICGINNTIEKKINNELRLEKNGKKVLLFVSNKEQILKELDLLSINESSLFPEIDHVSKYITARYSE